MGVLDDVTVVELSIAIAAPSCCGRWRSTAPTWSSWSRAPIPTSPACSARRGRAASSRGRTWTPRRTSARCRRTSARSGWSSSTPQAARPRCARLLANADVFVTNYSTPAVRALGLGLRGRGRGQPAASSTSRCPASAPTRPSRTTSSWPGARTRRPLVGLDELTGYPDQDPAGIATIAPPDYFAGLHALAAVLTGARAPRPHRRGQLHRHRPVRDDRLVPRPVPARPRAQRAQRRRAPATGWRGWRRRGATRAPARTRGWPSPSPTTTSGRRSPRCSAAPRSASSSPRWPGGWPTTTSSTS